MPRIVIVTGGTSGIGLAIARRHVAAGDVVRIGSIDADQVSPADLGLPESAVGLTRCDVGKEADVAALVDAVIARHGRLDVMVNNAGVSGVGGPISQIPAEGYAATMSVLLDGVFFGIKHAAAAMERQGAGVILNMASITGLVTHINASHVYSAAKSAVIQLTRTAALELGPMGVRVNCICPGYIATPIFGRAMNMGADDIARSVAAAEEVFAPLQPIRRAGRADDVAAACLWLASDEASFVTGHALVVDGGASLGVGLDPEQGRFSLLKRALSQER